MISLFNDAPRRRPPPMGHVAPFLYQTAVSSPRRLHRHQRGQHRCLSGSLNGHVLRHSFGATKGWDATSGLGSPKFDQLLKIASKTRSDPPAAALQHAAKLVQSRDRQAEALGTPA